MGEAALRSQARGRFFAVPGSWVGWASVAVAVLAVASLFARRLVGGVRGAIALSIAAGAVAAVAVIWKRDRSILVWIPLAIGGFWALWAAASYLVP